VLAIDVVDALAQRGLAGVVERMVRGHRSGPRLLIDAEHLAQLRAQRGVHDLGALSARICAV
jgi:hypothetical protein